MAFSTGQFSEYLDDIFHQVLFQEFPKQPDDYRTINNIFASRKNFETDGGLTGLGLMNLTGEGEGVSYDDPEARARKQYTHNKFTLGVQITEEMWADDQVGKIRQLPSAIAWSSAYTTNIQGFLGLNNGFDSSFPGSDGVELFSTAHPLEKSSSTGNNKLAVDADLYVTQLKSLINIFEQTVNEQKRQSEERLQAVLQI